MDIQEWPKDSPYKNVQTHIFELWRQISVIYKFRH